jgi:hypothetical protein
LRCTAKVTQRDLLVGALAHYAASVHVPGMVLVKEPSFAAFLFAMFHLQQSTGFKFRVDLRRARVEPMRCDFT